MVNIDGEGERASKCVWYIKERESQSMIVWIAKHLYAYTKV